MKYKVQNYSSLTKNGRVSTKTVYSTYWLFLLSMLFKVALDMFGLEGEPIFRRAFALSFSRSVAIIAILSLVDSWKNTS